jgi:hypothetical protein
MAAKRVHIVKKVLARLLVVIVALWAYNRLYKMLFWEKDLDEHAYMLLDLTQVQDTSDMLYFGESSNFSFHPDDKVKRRISDFISDHFPDKRMGTLNMAAYHGNLFLPVIKNIDTASPVETVIVTMNMRTFNQDVIHGELETALQKSARMYHPNPPLLNRFFMAFNFYDNQEAIDRDYKMWQDWTYDTLKSDVDSISFPAPTIRQWCYLEKFPLPEGGEDMPKRILADHYIKGYAFHITSENPRVKDFDEMVEVARDKNIQLVFNLLAENVDYADSLVGSNLVWLMRKNRDFLVERYSKKGVLVVDNLEVVAGEDFTDQNWTTEHYTERGRRAIAKNAADAILRE